tara:strand:+ start:684 stop:1160 length:477 start_codon:yes stop_codon:yes gene_type:complete
MKNSHPAPDPNVLFYKRVLDNGRTEIATMQTIEQYEGAGSWRGRFFVPGQAPFYMDQYSDELSKWEPIFAMTQNDINDVIERVAQRVVEILDSRDSDAVDIITSGMNVVMSETVEEAVEKAVDLAAPEESYECGDCGKTYKYEKSYKKHLRQEHKSRA